MITLKVTVDSEEAKEFVEHAKTLPFVDLEEEELYLSVEQKAALDQRMEEDRSSYLSEKEAIEILNKKYGL